jgi:hypothetical protein
MKWRDHEPPPETELRWWERADRDDWHEEAVRFSKERDKVHIEREGFARCPWGNRKGEQMELTA